MLGQIIPAATRTGHIRLLFYSLWIFSQLTQASTTNLLFDEAYYWFCSFHIDWGHFYYPPFINLLSRAGYSVFPNELGLRLFFIFSSSLGVFLLEALIKPKKLLLFYSILSSIVFLQVGGIFAAPDIPLFLWGVCFFITLQKYLKNASLKNVVILSVCTALSLYTKYHGILIVTASFIFLLPHYYKKGTYYLWPILSLLLFTPHIVWQIENGFPTVIFHLMQRPSTEWFSLRNFDYIFGQLLFAGPITGFFLFYSVFKKQFQNLFDQLLRFNLLFIYAFFFLISLYTHVEVNWGMLALIPSIALGYSFLSETPKLRRIFYKTIPISLFLALILRLGLAFPEKFPIERLHSEFSGWKTFAQTIDSIAKDRPVVMMTRYQQASIYAFHSKRKFVHVVYPHQPSDFRLFRTDERLQGKEVVVVSRDPFKSAIKFHTNKGEWYYAPVSEFWDLSKIRLKKTSWDEATQTIKIRLENPYQQPINYCKDKNCKAIFSVRFWNNENKLKTQYIGDISGFLNTPTEVKLNIPEGENINYQFFIQTGILYPMPCSRIFKTN